MTLFSGLRNRMQATAADDGAPPAELSGDLTDRFAGLGEREACTGLHQFNQVELTAIHAFERSHRNREPVLDKLRYLRQREPLPGYDALEPEAVTEALSSADADTIKAVREYERKHQNRPSVNKAVVEALRSCRERSPQQPAVEGNGLPIRVRPETGIGTP